MIRNMYITVSVVRTNYEDARNYFVRVGAELSMHLSRLGSCYQELNAVDRLKILYGFYRHGEKVDFHFDLEQSMKKGHSFKDYICPDRMEIENDYSDPFFFYCVKKCKNFAYKTRMRLRYVGDFFMESPKIFLF